MSNDVFRHPIAECSCSGSPLKFENGRTAIDLPREAGRLVDFENQTAEATNRITRTKVIAPKGSRRATYPESPNSDNHAAVYVDKKDERKPVVLVLSDHELPASKWSDSSEMTMYRMDRKFNGVAFWMDEKREIFRTDYYAPGRFPTGVSGLFSVKFDDPSGKSFLVPHPLQIRQPPWILPSNWTSVLA